MSIAEAVMPSPAAASKRNGVQLEAAETRIFLRGVSWATYAELRDSPSNNQVRMTYDNGALEFMSPSGKHAKVTHIIGYIIDEWTLLQNIEIEFGGNMTFRKPEAKRGLEADQCYWITSASLVLGKDEIDLSIDPPPDLAIEVEVSNPAIQKMPIYQTLGVSEVWCWRERKLTVLELDQDRKYAIVNGSRLLPGFPFQLAEEFIQQRESESGTALHRRIRKAMAALPHRRA